MQLTAYDIIKRPVITEHSMDMVNHGIYTFEVAIGANKIDIKKAVEKVFKVKVDRVTTMRMIGKPKRQGVHIGKRSDWKKAMVKLTKDSKPIEIFEGIL